MTPTHDPFLAFAHDVAEALDDGRPVVALESTIITHGMPWPENARTAMQVEADVRAAGAVPATIALLDGRMKVGLTATEIERLARDTGVAKASRRDIAALLAAGEPGGTTVAATMLIAARAGIAVFATGGIGGVHRGAETTLDISADIEELGRTSVLVVCAGAKSILDLPKTLEALETRGVPVWGYKTAELPAFFAATSGLPLDRRYDDVVALARAAVLQRRLGLRQGILVCNPPPADVALPAALIEEHLRQALAEAEAESVSGKAMTPFLLKRLNALTGGRSLSTNIALIRSNAQLAARIAVAMTRPAA
jgi:pseudouridylate synthase